MNIFIIIFLVLFLVGVSGYTAFKWGWKSLALLIPALGLLVIPAARVEFINVIIPICCGIAGGIIRRYEKNITLYILVTVSLITVLLSAKHYIIKKPVIVLPKKKIVAELLKKNKAPKDLKQDFLQNYDQWMEYITIGIPFLIFINGLIIAGFSYAMLTILFTRFLKIPFSGLELFKLPDYLIFLLIASLAIFLFLKNDVAKQIAINTLLMTAILYFIQSLGIMKYFLLKKGFPGGLFLPLIIVTLILLNYFSVFLVVVSTGFGTLDLWADFRKLDNKNDTIKE